MSGTFRATGGESWSSIARQTTGNDLDGDLIRRANPGVTDPIPPGTILQIPEQETPPEESLAPGDTKIVVNGSEIGTVDGIEIGRSVDAIGKASFTVPNEPETRRLFAPMAGAKVVISAGPTRITGRCESPSPQNSSDRKTLTISAYDTPGILERVGPPIEKFPLEWTNSNLVTIANDLCFHHGIYCDFRADAGPSFKRVDISPGAVVLQFLSDLASQRGPVISSTPFGALLVWEGVKPGRPVARLEKGQAGVVNVAVSIDEDRYYSSVTGTVPARTKRGGRKDKGDGAKFTVRNPHANDQVRPYNAEFEDIDPGELEPAVKTLAGRVFSGIFSVEIELARWTDDSGDIWQENTTLELKSPEDFIDDFYEFTIADVTLRQSSDGGRTAAIRCVFPGVYTGEIPEVLPWQ